MAGELDAGKPHVQFDEGALETCDRVTRLRPTLPTPLPSLKRYDEALRHLDKASELFPAVPIFAYLKVIANYRKGDPDAARSIIEPLKTQPELAKAPPFIALFAAQAARDGRVPEARRMMAQLEQMRMTQYVEPFLVIEVCNALNDRRQLMVWLRRADEERSSFFVYLAGVRAVLGLDPTVLAYLLR